MKEFTYTIKDEMGIHARPAGLFVKEAAAFPCAVTITKDGKEVDAKRIFGVMGLGVKCGQEITLKTDGEKEEEAMETLGIFLEENLYYPIVGLHQSRKNVSAVSTWQQTFFTISKSLGRRKEKSMVIQGKSVFSGIAIGRLSVYNKAENVVKRTKITDIDGEIKRFEDAREE